MRFPPPTLLIVGFEHRQDAERFRDELGSRFARFGLELHPGKTRLVEFGRRAARDRATRGEGKPETFTFLGFTHICATSKNGRFWIRRKTDSKRARAQLAEVKAEIRRRRCLPIPEQGRWLATVVSGHQAAYAVPGNSDAVNAFRTQVIRHWRKALRRRSQRTRITWARMNRLATRWITTRTPGRGGVQAGPPAGRQALIHRRPDHRMDELEPGRAVHDVCVGQAGGQRGGEPGIDARDPRDQRQADLAGHRIKRRPVLGGLIN